MFAVHKDNENIVGMLCYVISFKQNFVNYKITF